MIAVNENAPQRPPSHAYHGALLAPTHATLCLVAKTYVTMARVPTVNETTEACCGLAIAAPSFALKAPKSGRGDPATTAIAIQSMLSIKPAPVVRKFPA